MSASVALVTGAGRGIGRACALALARQGFSVALNDREPGEALDESLEAVRATGASATLVVFDVADLAAHEPALTQVETTLGPLTTLVNNAGVGVAQRGDPLEVSSASFDRCIQVNTRAPFFLIQAFARRLLAREREASQLHSIVNITSSNAVAVAEARSEYCVSKAAAAMASKAWAVRLGRENIAVYDVQPGLIATDMTAPVISDYEKRARDGLTLLPRLGKPQEVGEIVASLASGRLPYTTGQVVSADAGMLVSRF